MPLAKPIGKMTALLVALAWLALSLQAQTMPPAQASKQTTKTPPAAKPPAQMAGKAQQAPKKQEVAKKTTKAAGAPKSADPAAPTRSSATPPQVARRDPFDPLVGRQNVGGGGPERLPPGKAGLIISTLRLDGLVRAPNGMIAVVSNPQQRVYFLREGDQLYDGSVERITMAMVAFHEVGKDAFGKPVDRTVTKRLYPGSGEQP